MKKLVHAATVVAAFISILAPRAPRSARAESTALHDPDAALAGLPEPGPRATLSDLRGRYNQVLAQGLVRLRAGGSGDDHIVGDSTDAAGMRWTKCTNLGLDLVGTLVAEARGFMPASEAREHVRRILEILGGLRTYHGIFPEIIQLDEGVRPEIKAGRIRYSSIDSAWVTVALTLVEARYDAGPDAGDESPSAELATRARALVAGQDYGVFVGPDGLLGGGFWVDARTYQIVESLGFSYGDRASEARPLILALVGLGKVAPSAFDNMRTSWALKEGLAVMEGWRWSAFVEMTGELWLDEMALAPLSLGRSHANYLEATTRVARRLGHAVWGYAPACDVERGYSEYGLDRAEMVSPYAGGLLAMTGDPRAVANLDRILAVVANAAGDGTTSASGANLGRPLADGLDPRTGRVACAVARTLDQSLLFLSLNADVVRALARRTTWYASAEQRTRELDRTSQPPALLRSAAPSATIGLNAGAGAGAGAGAPVAPGVDDLERGLAQMEGPGPGDARAWGQTPDATSLEGLLAAIRRSESEAGGSTDLARSQLHLASATTARAWADFSPELALAVRHPFGASLTDPTWRGIAQARVALSFDKLWTALAAGDAEGGARAAVGQRERQGWRRGLEAYLALYLAERRVRVLDDHRASLAGFASGLSRGGQREPKGGGALDDLVLLQARLSALDAALADARATQQLALERLRALSGASTITGSGLDPRLDPGQVLGLIGEATGDPAAGDAGVDVDGERATAEIAQHRSLLARANSRAPYVPELRAEAFVDVPKVDSASGNGATEKTWAIDRVTGALSLAFDVRPGSGPEREAGASAVARSLHRLDQVREDRAARVARARARLRARLSIWAAHPETVAGSLYRDAGNRLQRGEVAVSTLIAASRGLMDSQDLAERAFGEAVAAGVALAADGVRPLSDLAVGRVGGAPADGLAPVAISRADASAAARAAILTAPAVRAADAEADRARAEAERAHRDSWHLGLEAGIAYPLHARTGAIVDQSIGSPMSLGPVALATERIREPTLLGRLSFSLAGSREAAQAADAEAELRAVQSELAHKRRLAEQAGARLDLAFARSLDRAAASHASFCAEQLRLAQQMQTAGLTDDPGTVHQADLRAKAARARWLDAREELEEAELRTSQLLGRPAEAPLAITETPDELVAWLREKHYPEVGLLGFRSALGTKVAELEQRRAQATLRALRNPPSAVDLTVQATEQLRGYGHALGLAIGLRLDPVKNPAKIVEAARVAGENQGKIRGEADELEAERRVAHAELDAATRAQALAEESRRRLVEVLEDLTRNQAMRPELHASLKARARGAVEAELQEIDLGVIETRARAARAKLATLELDPPGTTPAVPSPNPAAADGSPAATGMAVTAQGAAIDPGAETSDRASDATSDRASDRDRTLERTIDQLVASDPELDAASGASRAMALERANQAPGVLAGLHLAGPIVGASYGIGRSPTGAVAGTTVTLRDADAFAAAGLSYDLAEGFAFLGTKRQARASEWAATSAHELAEARALAQLGRLWNARAAVRAAEANAVEHRRRLEDLAVPRYHAAQISAEALAAASVSASTAAAALRAAEGVERKERAALALRGVTVGDRLLDEVGRRTAPETVPEATARLARWEESELRAGATLTALRERQAAARDEAGLGYARLFGTTTLLLEVDPQRRRTTLDVPDAPTGTERQLAWVSSLFLPLRLGALGEGAEAGARAEVRGAEVRVAERALRASFAESRLRLVLAADAWRASERARRDAGLAFAEVDRRYRGALGGANADTHAEAADDVATAEAHARAARAELTDLLAPLQRRIQ